ncbi:MAG: DUF697 domain-containing protein [Oscillatoriales cyanobacterium SM2_2_1]|nr:DUF697 domain-containing protein [Oscillatoriales cyanobacterium SM2_2_1]
MDRVAAATESLTTLEHQLTLIQDQVMREALLLETEALKQGFYRIDRTVAVFGVGSAGKTTLVRALCHHCGLKLVPDPAIGATLGTTVVGQQYPPIALPDSGTSLILVDCPGILEAGEAGEARAQAARQLATQADLLLFVIDDDLRQSEFAVMRSLAEIGKRMVLVFNKIDRLTTAAGVNIHQRLIERVQGFLPPEDVVAIAAQPQPLTLPNGEQWVAPVQITPLLKRLADILSYEGEELAADNALLQTQELSQRTQGVLTQQRQRQAQRVVEKYQWLVAAALCANPLPVVDFLATAAIHAQMAVEIARVFDCALDVTEGKSLVSALTQTLVRLGIVKGVLRLVGAAISVTVVGAMLKIALQAIAGAYLTRIAGYSFITYFRQNQSWGDGGIMGVVREQFKLNRREAFLKDFIQEALQRVVTPERH